MKNIIKLTDTEIAQLIKEGRNELTRRLNAQKSDSSAIIWGQEMAKRATTVAVAGNHSILFVGPPDCGKTMLRALSLELGLEETYEARWCPCGFQGHPDKVCDCSVIQIRKHQAKFPVADIVIEVPTVPTVPAKYRNPKQFGTTIGDIRCIIKDIPAHTDLSLDQDSSNLLKCSIAELGFSVDESEKIKRVGRTIANLDRSKNIQSSHICEAINYQSVLKRTGY